MRTPIEPPSNVNAERAVLGACLMDQVALATACELLKPEDFYDPSNHVTFEIMSEMYTADRIVDSVTLEEELSDRKLLDRVGGNAFIMRLLDDVTTTSNVQHYAKLITDRSIRRKLIDAGNEIGTLAMKSGRPLPELLDSAEKLIFDAGQNKATTSYRHARDLTNSVFAQIKASFEENEGIIDQFDGIPFSCISGYRSGFTDLDNILGGFAPGSLNILAARPSMGKTALALNIAQFGGGDNNPPVLIFSLEMPATQLIQRMLSAESGVNLSRITHGYFSTSDFDAVRQASDTLAKRNIFINDATQLSALDFRARCRRFKSRVPDLGLVIVDYLQLMSSGEKRNEGRVQEVSDISRLLKAVAREMDCPVIALSQLSREAERRPDKKPQLSDLRDSGAIEQDADTVLMLYREDYYTETENNDLTDSRADLRIAKNRNGGTGVLHLTFKREITRFLNYGAE